jgi:large subunit ribosomal protein L15
MPIQRRLPKFGFTSRKGAYYAEVRLSELNALEASEIDVQVLIDAGVVPRQTKTVKVIKSGTLDRAITTKGIRVTAGAKEDIAAAGGSVGE